MICPICARDRRLVQDHHHPSGISRWRLCRACNAGLGMFGDSAERLERALAYLRSSPHDDAQPETEHLDWLKSQPVNASTLRERMAGSALAPDVLQLSVRPRMW